jgi:pantoate--beta-alanine ligase
MIKTISTIDEMRTASDRLRREERRIGFVPTMGFLHEGHLSLMRVGRKSADTLIASIFVNPAQFGPNEDFDTYPRDLQRDLDLCSKENVDLVFMPTSDDLYPEGYETYVKLDHLPKHLCGLSRPVFFTGVATVVMKLFNIVKPHFAVFGEKDFQQLQIIKRMVSDLNVGIEIISAPIVREPDGLAMSSRNAYLTPTQRPAALTLIESLKLAKEMVDKGLRESIRIIEKARKHIEGQPETEIDYLTICDPETLNDVDYIDKSALMALAVMVGNTRLIDNMILRPDEKALEES